MPKVPQPDFVPEYLSYEAALLTCDVANRKGSKWSEQLEMMEGNAERVQLGAECSQRQVCSYSEDPKSQLEE